MSRKRQSHSREARDDGYVRVRVTHCVACNYERTRDFEVCPNCGAERMNVIVLKHYIKVKSRKRRKRRAPPSNAI